MESGGLIDRILQSGGLVDRISFNLLKKPTGLLRLALEVDVLLEDLPLLVELVKRLRLEEGAGVDALRLQLVVGLQGMRGRWQRWCGGRIQWSHHASTSFS